MDSMSSGKASTSTTQAAAGRQTLLSAQVIPKSKVARAKVEATTQPLFEPSLWKNHRRTQNLKYNLQDNARRLAAVNQLQDESRDHEATQLQDADDPEVVETSQQQHDHVTDLSDTEEKRTLDEPSVTSDAPISTVVPPIKITSKRPIVATHDSDSGGDSVEKGSPAQSLPPRKSTINARLPKKSMRTESENQASSSSRGAATSQPLSPSRTRIQVSRSAPREPTSSARPARNATKGVQYNLKKKWKTLSDWAGLDHQDED